MDLVVVVMEKFKVKSSRKVLWKVLYKFYESYVSHASCLLDIIFDVYFLIKIIYIIDIFIVCINIYTIVTQQENKQWYINISHGISTK